MATRENVVSHVLAERAKNRSWRAIANDYRLKDHTVIYRIVNEPDYWPKDPAIIKKLERTPTQAKKKSRIPRYGKLMDEPIHRLTWRLINREPMP